MSQKYAEFIKANPDAKSRIEALTSGVNTPDPKAITLLSMEPYKPYTWFELYERVLDFCGMEKNNFPLTSHATWIYCHGSRGYKGSLEEIGAVVELKVKRKVTPYKEVYAIAYQKTDAGEDFGDPAACLGIRLVNKLIKLKQKPKYYSLFKILGTPNKKGEAKYRRGYVVYEIVKLLVENKNEELRRIDIIEELPELNKKVISNCLNSLGEAGVIDYKSPYRDIKGKRAKGWAKYRLKKKIDYEEVLDRIKKFNLKFDSPIALKKIVAYINSNPTEEFEYNELASKLNIKCNYTSEGLSLLERLDYLECEFKGGEKLSIAKANEATHILWNDFLEPIGKAAISLNPYIEEFMLAKELYEDEVKLREDIRNVLWIYDRERTRIGKKGGEEIRNAILNVLADGKEKKLSYIKAEVNERISRKVSQGAILRQLKNLIKTRKIEKVKKSYYKMINFC